MGVVYKAEDTRLHRFVALKFLAGSICPRPAGARPFSTRSASRLRVESSQHLHDSRHRRRGGQAFIAMEFLDGVTLKQFLAGKASGNRKTARCLHRYCRWVGSRALPRHHPSRHQTRQHLCHQARPHQDSRFRPRESFLVCQLLRISSIETSARPAPSTTSSSPVPAAPSAPSLTCPPSKSAAKISTRAPTSSRLAWCSTKWPLAVLPFRGDTSGVIFRDILDRPPVPPSRVNPDVSPRLEEIIQKCLEKDRDVRCQSAAELRADLKRLKRDSDTAKSAPVQSASAVAVTPSLASRWWLWAVSLALAVAAILGIVWWRTPVPPPRILGDQTTHPRQLSKSSLDDGREPPLFRRELRLEFPHGTGFRRWR